MINNLIISGRDYRYGYDGYYITRKDESIDFPSNSSIALSLNPKASDYTVTTMPVSVYKEVSGTLKSYSITPYGYLVKVSKHLLSTNVEALESSEGGDVYTYELVNLHKGEELSPSIVPGTLTGTIFNDGESIQTFKVNLDDPTTLIISNIGSPSVKATSGSVEDNIITLNWNDPTTESYVLAKYEYESPDQTSVNSEKQPVFNYHKTIKNEIYENVGGRETSVNMSFPVVRGSVSGVIKSSSTVVQTFTVLDNGNLSLTNVNISGGTYVSSGSLNFSTGVMTIVWFPVVTPTPTATATATPTPTATATAPTPTPTVPTPTPTALDEEDTSVELSYNYGYDFVSIYGKTNLDTKYVKIMSTLKCKYKNSYTNVSSRLFYTRCRSFQTLCSSTSSGYVPAITICSENLF